MAVVCLLMPVASYADQQEELDNLRHRISDMQKEITATRESKTEAADALQVSERTISDTNRKIFQLTDQQQAADLRLNLLQTQQQQLTVNIDMQKHLLQKMLYRQYLSGRHDYLKIVLNNEDMNKIARNLRYFQYIARHRINWMTDLHDKLRAIKLVSDEIHVQSKSLQDMRDELSRQNLLLSQQQHSKKMVLQRISAQLTSQRKEVTKLQFDENRLTNLVEKITKMLAKPNTKSFFHNDKLPDSHFDGKPFQQLQGLLAQPVNGEITNQFGSTRPDSTVIWKGFFIKAASGATVKAIATGRVVFADWLRGFGNLLIIDHGNAYMSLYGDNESLYKQVGDEVHAGDSIATVGNSGGNTESGLYFELRHQGLPLDPAKWLEKN
jgi:septal ring factor EnvC (AmiA/AmiB activator)